MLGGAGMLGHALRAEARRRGWATLALAREQADVRDADRLIHWAESFRPEVVFNCAAHTRVDLCEVERELAFEVNGVAVSWIAEAAERVGARLVQVSTDYVFDGHPEHRARQSLSPYLEDAPAAPLSVYGASKLEGERRALHHAGSLVVRASWLFGPGGPNFARTMVGLIEKGNRQLRVVDDQEGAPTYTPFLARALCDLSARGATGLYHYRNRPAATWFEFTREISRQWTDGAVEVIPVTTDEFPRPAPRPAYSVLDVARAEAFLGRPVEPWLWGLIDYLGRIRDVGLAAA
ncbi:MAG TPA: dTDP-4-dehydrorhamnose reductase [Thermoanaerobaculia bacterium]|nr:dTDP-4-dehydrorhamnose reductase [Thermoanaerobaculia bacterium]